MLVMVLLEALIDLLVKVWVSVVPTRSPDTPCALVADVWVSIWVCMFPLTPSRCWNSVLLTVPSAILVASIPAKAWMLVLAMLVMVLELALMVLLVSVATVLVPTRVVSDPGSVKTIVVPVVMLDSSNRAFLVLSTLSWNRVKLSVNVLFVRVWISVVPTTSPDTPWALVLDVCESICVWILPVNPLRYWYSALDTDPLAILLASTPAPAFMEELARLVIVLLSPSILLFDIV